GGVGGLPVPPSHPSLRARRAWQSMGEALHPTPCRWIASPLCGSQRRSGSERLGCTALSSVIASPKGVAIHGATRPTPTQPLLRPLRQRWAAAEQVTVAINVVDAVHHRPELVGCHPAQREYRLLPGIAALPVAGDVGQGMRGIMQRIVLGAPLALLHHVDLPA